MDSVGKWKISTYILAATTLGALWYGRGRESTATSPKMAAHDAAYEKRLTGLARLRIPPRLAGFDEEQLLQDLRAARSRKEIELLCERLAIFGTDRALDTLEEVRKVRRDVTGYVALAMGGIGSDEATRRLIAMGESGRTGDLYWAVRGLAKSGNERAHEQLFSWVLSGNHRVKLPAIDALGEVRTEEALEVLVEVASTTETEVLTRVVGALGAMATQEAVDFAIELADRGNRLVRQRALGAMPRSLTSAQQEWLMNVLADSDTRCAALAAEALGNAKATDALPLLLDAAHRGDPELRRGAIRGLAAIGGKEAYKMLGKLFAKARSNEAYELGRALIDGGPEGEAELLAAISNGHPARRELVSLLHELTGPEVDAVRVQILRDGTPRERQTIAGQLTGSDDPEVAEIMISLARNGTNQDRYAALNFLAQNSSEEAQAAMMEVASGAGQASVEALRMLGDRRASDPEVQALLADALASGTPNKVQAATWALANSGSAYGREAVLGALRSENPTVANAALSAVGQLGQGPEVIEALKALATDAKSDQTRSSALYQLANSGDPEASDLVVAAIAKGDDMASGMVSTLMYRGGPEAERAIEVAMSSESPMARQSLASALGSQGGKEALPLLTELLEDEDPGVKSSAIYALGNLGSKSAAEQLYSLATSGEKSTRQTAIGAFANSGDPRAGQVITEALRSGDETLAQTALYNIHNVGAEADEAMLSLLDDDSVSIQLRRQAANALVNRGALDADKAKELDVMAMPSSGPVPGMYEMDILH